MRVKRVAEVARPLGGDLTLTPHGARSPFRGVEPWIQEKECERVGRRAIAKDRDDN